MLPELFLERMQDMLGEEFNDFLASFEQEKYQALRLNALKQNANGQNAAQCSAWLGFSENEKNTGESRGVFHLTPVPWAENGYYYEKEDQPGKHPFHEAGVYYIQEPSAMAPVTLLEVKPGERILDLCAAPGGKSTQIAAALQGKGLLLCNEIHPARAKILSENVERMGIRNAVVTNETPARLAENFPEYFDRILVDAPCSGEGMFRKNEAACDEWSPDNVENCAARQDEILDCAARMLRPGGRLVYSTCTFAPLENEGSISRFVIRHPAFRILPTDVMKEKLERAQFGSEETANIKSDNKFGNKADNESDNKFGNKADNKAGNTAGTERPVTCNGVGAWVENPASDIDATLRLWPHRIKGEGHYAAVLEKTAEEYGIYSMHPAGGIEKGIPEKSLARDWAEYFTFAKETLRVPLEGNYLRFGDNLYLMPQDMPAVKGLKVLRPGLHIGTLKKNRFEPSHALALALSPKEAVHVWNLSSEEPGAAAFLNGQTFPAEGEKGWYLICVDGFSVGWGKLAGGIMKNHYPKGLRR